MLTYYNEGGNLMEMILASGLCVAVYSFCGYVKYLCRGARN